MNEHGFYIYLLNDAAALHIWLGVAEKFIWCGLAAVGFAILFNVPTRTLLLIGLLGGVGGFAKFSAIHLGISDVLAPLCGSVAIGILCIPFSHYKHAPPVVFYIPALIPLVPGLFMYRTMIGLMKLVGEMPIAEYNQVLHDTTLNGIKALFITMELSMGIVIPLLIMRTESVKNLRVRALIERLGN